MNLTKLYEMDDKRQEGKRLEQENSARAVSARLGISINSVNTARTGRNAMARRFKKSTCTIARLLKHRSPDDTGNNIAVPSWAVQSWTKSPDLSVGFYY